MPAQPTPPVPDDLPTFDDVLAAARRIGGHVYRTPVLTSQSLDEELGASLFFKCENFQRTGAFKFRGASNAVWSLDDETAARGVVTHSSGNHGAALARAAQERGIPAHVVMPRGASEVKRLAVEAFGARVVESEPTQKGREETTAALQEETGAELIHPYDDARVIAGQGTCCLELVQRVADLDIVIAPISGGGLLAGTALVARRMTSQAQIVGAEPSGADDAYRSFEAGRIVPVDDPTTMADGLRATIGIRPFAILSEAGVRIVTVDEDEIRRALRLAWERLKVVIEPSSAVVLAALTGGKLEIAGRRIGVVLSGGNVTLPKDWP